jgi:hypothetical protein
VRKAILAAGGQWGWFVHQVNPHLLPSLLSLRTELGLKITEVAAMKSAVPGVVAIGTRMEMEWVRRIADQHGLPSDALPVDPGTHAPLDLTAFSLTDDSSANLVLIGLEPVEVGLEDFVSLESFRLKWRWIDP